MGFRATNLKRKLPLATAAASRRRADLRRNCDTPALDVSRGHAGELLRISIERLSDAGCGGRAEGAMDVRRG